MKPFLPPCFTPPCIACSEDGGQFRFSLPLQDLVSVDLQPEIYIRQVRRVRGSASGGPVWVVIV